MLLQGPTSSGKTSLVAYLAAQTGHRLIRINNHEHTDLQVGDLKTSCRSMAPRQGVIWGGPHASLSQP